jgi:hypothetical protein
MYHEVRQCLNVNTGYLKLPSSFDLEKKKKKKKTKKALYVEKRILMNI